MLSMMNIRPDSSERVNYNKSESPVYVGKQLLSMFPNFSGVSHWHEDVEFTVVLSGRMSYNVNGEILPLNAGEGVFVNARQLHYAFSDDCSECEFICLVFHPIVLCASPYIERKYINPILSDRAMPYYVLHGGIGWEGRILSDVKSVYDIQSESDQELKMQSLFYDMWGELYTHRKSIAREPESRSVRLTALRDMIAYIHKHYNEHISLADIAYAGAVGKTSCCSIFKQYINQSPNAYLNELRLCKGMELLASTDMSVSEISDEVGFLSASYFTELFHRYVNCTPVDYRRNKRLADNAIENNAD